MALEGVISQETSKGNVISITSKTKGQKVVVVSESLASVSAGMREIGKVNINDLHHLDKDYKNPIGDDYIADYFNESQHTDHVGHSKTKGTLGFKNGWQ